MLGICTELFCCCYFYCHLRKRSSNLSVILIRTHASGWCWMVSSTCLKLPKLSLKRKCQLLFKINLSRKLQKLLYFDWSYRCFYNSVLVSSLRRRPLAPPRAPAGRNPWGSGPHVTRPEQADQTPDAPPQILSEEGGGRPAPEAPNRIKQRDDRGRGDQGGQYKPSKCRSTLKWGFGLCDLTLLSGLSLVYRSSLTTSMKCTSSLKFGWTLKLSISSDSSCCPAHSIRTKGRATSKSSTRFRSRRPQNST